MHMVSSTFGDDICIHNFIITTSKINLQGSERGIKFRIIFNLYGTHGSDMALVVVQELPGLLTSNQIYSMMESQIKQLRELSI